MKGNDFVNKYYENNLDIKLKPTKETSDDLTKKFIISKYSEKIYFLGENL